MHNYLDFENSFFPAAPTTASLLTPVASFPGSILTHASGSPADIINDLIISTVKDVGATAHTRTFGANSSAIDLVSSITPALVAL